MPKGKTKYRLPALTLGMLLCGATSLMAQSRLFSDQLLSQSSSDQGIAGSEEDVDLNLLRNRQGNPETDEADSLDQPQNQTGLRGTIAAEGESTRRRTGRLNQRIQPRPTDGRPRRANPLDVGQDATLEPRTETDPYDPIGVRFGSFLLFPELVAEKVYNDNVFLSPTRPEGDWAVSVTPSLRLQSDWNRHSLEANVSAVRSFHERFESEDDESFAANLAGRVDLRRNTNVEASVGYSEVLEDRGDNDFPTNAAIRAQDRDYAGSLEGNHTFNRVTLTLRGDILKEKFGNAATIAGDPIDNGDRNYTERRLTGRVAYEFQPGVQAFVEGSGNKRDFERALDRNGLLPGSSGHDIQAGLAFKLTGKLTGEASAGYALQTPDERTLRDVNGLIFNSSLEYEASALTTFRVNAESTVAETTQAGSAGSIEREIEFEIEHKPRRNVTIAASIGYERETFAGTDNTSRDWDAGLRGEYLFTPSVGLIVSYERNESKSSTPGRDYTTNEVRFGLRVRR